MKSKDLKLIVKEKYSQIARQSVTGSDSSCCGETDCCSETDYSVFSESYHQLKGYNPGADLGLGCGLPTEYAGIKTGDSVLDLGSGAGNDCFVIRAIVGATGKVTGLDFTDEMLHKARKNAAGMEYENVVFVKGDIEEMPLPDNEFDVVVSNCVLNLVPDKNRAFSEIMRILKPHGHFCVSDVVTRGNLPKNLHKDAEMYAGCVSGAMEKDKYLKIIKVQGFTDMTLHKERKINIPGNILKNYLSDQEMEEFTGAEKGIFSITVSAYKA